MVKVKIFFYFIFIIIGILFFSSCEEWPRCGIPLYAICPFNIQFEPKE